MIIIKINNSESKYYIGALLETQFFGVHDLLFLFIPQSHQATFPLRSHYVLKKFEDVVRTCRTWQERSGNRIGRSEVLMGVEDLIEL